MAPVVHGLENKYSQYMPFHFLDIDDPNAEPILSAVDYNRAWRPYILLYNSAGEIDSVFVGVISGLEIEIAIQNLLIKEGIFTTLN